MEHRGKGAEGVGARGDDLTHDIDGDGARLADGHADLRAAVTLTQRAADLGIGGIDGETTDMDGTEARDDDGAIGRDFELLGFLRGTIDIDEDLVARAYHIGGRGSDVHIGLEGELILVEDVTTIDLLAIDGVVAGIDIDLGTGREVDGG